MGKRLLHQAACNHDEAAILKLVEAGEDVNEVEAVRRGALEKGIENRGAQFCSEISHGNGLPSNPYSRLGYGCSPASLWGMHGARGKRRVSRLELSC